MTLVPMAVLVNTLQFGYKVSKLGKSIINLRFCLEVWNFNHRLLQRHQWRSFTCYGSSSLRKSGERKSKLQHRHIEFLAKISWYFDDNDEFIESKNLRVFFNPNYSARFFMCSFVNSGRRWMIGGDNSRVDSEGKPLPPVSQTENGLSYYFLRFVPNKVSVSKPNS